mmetsp:Transcript_6378/g.16493  ORF Transcript_6378/g.16493 Transcript_6378/m.16493 type:complete len:318 (-) Transcript_6378:583-1536(-)
MPNKQLRPLRALAPSGTPPPLRLLRGTFRPSSRDRQLGPHRHSLEVIQQRTAALLDPISRTQGAALPQRVSPTRSSDAANRGGVACGAGPVTAGHFIARVTGGSSGPCPWLHALAGPHARQHPPWLGLLGAAAAVQAPHDRLQSQHGAGAPGAAGGIRHGAAPCSRRKVCRLPLTRIDAVRGSPGWCGIPGLSGLRGWTSCRRMDGAGRLAVGGGRARRRAGRGAQQLLQPLKSLVAGSVLPSQSRRLCGARVLRSSALAACTASRWALLGSRRRQRGRGRRGGPRDRTVARVALVGGIIRSRLPLSGRVPVRNGVP